MEEGIWGRSTATFEEISDTEASIQDTGGSIWRNVKKSAKRLEYLADRLEKGKRISSDKLPVEGTELILERGEEIHVVMVTNTGLIYREEFLYVIISGSRKNNGNEL
ncbi:putative phage related protein [Trichonephila clavata]|uniref:Putative phage related protein n=1 Tax=Trichonephila clavata TaxID=2740835 RepID=A0A8X6KBH5_TRICU|nr:putative phage related protein [Trichonephila clavata]